MQVVGNCRSLILTVDDSKQICIANRVGGESVCQDDSGGPILQQQNGQWYVQGFTAVLGLFVKRMETRGVSFVFGS